MSHTFRHASQADDRHIVAWTFQRPAAAERLARGETVKADGRHAWHWLRPQYRWLQEICARILGLPNRTYFWSYGNWEAVAGGWVYQDRNVVFITLRVPIDQAALLDAGVWEMIINSSYVGHAAPEHTPDCDTDQEWGCAPVTDFYRRADAAAGGPWWAHVDRAGSFTEPDSPFVAEVNASWDRVLRLGPEAWVEVVTPQLHPEWVVEARPVSTYRRRPAQPAPNVTARPGFATAAHRQLEALRRNSPIYRAPEIP